MVICGLTINAHQIRLAAAALAVALILLALTSATVLAASTGAAPATPFPPTFDSYGDSDFTSIASILAHRVRQTPFNLVATLIFLAAIIHTFMAAKLMAISHRRQKAHAEKIAAGKVSEKSIDIPAGILHFLGEIEVIFGLWVIPLMLAIGFFFDWSTVVNYFENSVNLTEPAFVIVIMVLASTRPILHLAEAIMRTISKSFGGSLAAFWVTVMTIGPLLGSFITEPAAMTISALLLAQRFYDLGPSTGFKYATLGLLFVNISIGGTLTHFAAPPILMVAGPWDWGTGFMLANFGWKAVVGIVLSNILYFWLFRGELSQLQSSFALRELKDEISKRFISRDLVDREWSKAELLIEEQQQIFDTVYKDTENFVTAVRDKVAAEIVPALEAEGIDRQMINEAMGNRFDEVLRFRLRRSLPALLPANERSEFQDPDWDKREDPVPVWITLVHVFFMGWTIINAHHAPLFLLGILFFLGFAQVTAEFQNRIRLQTAMLVGFFLAGLVIHGGVQGWWIAPVLGSLSETPLMLGATVLTAFNDNAAITYLSTLVPGFTDSMKYSVVAGAVAGGGLTVIANAPNPAGQSILKGFFENGISPALLLKAAIIPTAISWLALWLL